MVQYTELLILKIKYNKPLPTSIRIETINYSVTDAHHIQPLAFSRDADMHTKHILCMKSRCRQM